MTTNTPELLSTAVRQLSSEFIFTFSALQKVLSTTKKFLE